MEPRSRRRAAARARPATYIATITMGPSAMSLYRQALARPKAGGRAYVWAITTTTVGKISTLLITARIACTITEMGSLKRCRRRRVSRVQAGLGEQAALSLTTIAMVISIWWLRITWISIKQPLPNRERGHLVFGRACRLCAGHGGCADPRTFCIEIAATGRLEM